MNTEPNAERNIHEKYNQCVRIQSALICANLITTRLTAYNTELPGFVVYRTLSLALVT